MAKERPVQEFTFEIPIKLVAKKSVFKDGQTVYELTVDESSMKKAKVYEGQALKINEWREISMMLAQAERSKPGKEDLLSIHFPPCRKYLFECAWKEPKVKAV